MDGTWSIIRIAFRFPFGGHIYDGELGKQSGVPRLLAEVFLKNRGFFVAWESYDMDERWLTKCVVVGGVRCEDTEEAVAIAENLRDGLLKCDCSMYDTRWSDPGQDWREVLNEGRLFGVEEQDAAFKEEWIGKGWQWSKAWEAFNAEEQEVEEWLKREDFNGEEVLTLEALLRKKARGFRAGQVLGESSFKEVDREMKKRIERRITGEMEMIRMCDGWWARFAGVKR